MMFPLNHGVMAAANAAGPASYVDAVLSFSPYVYYRFEGTGDATSFEDSSGNERHMNPVTTPALSFDQPGLVPSDDGRSLSSGNYAVPSGYTTSGGTDVTLIVWLKAATPSPSGTARFARMGDNFDVRVADQVVNLAFDNQVSGDIGPKFLSDSIMVAFTFEFSTGIVRLFVDGVEHVGGAFPYTAPSIPTGNIYAIDGGSFTKFVDEWALFTSLLTPTEIESIYVAGTGPKPVIWTPDQIVDQVDAWYDPSDLTTLRQGNSEDTAPAENDGDEVRFIMDKSGNGMHLQSSLGFATLRVSGGLKWLEVIEPIELGYYVSGVPALNGNNTCCFGAGIINSNSIEPLFTTANGDDRQSFFLDARTGSIRRIWIPAFNSEYVDLSQQLGSGEHVLTTQRNGDECTGWADRIQGTTITTSLVGSNAYIKFAAQQAGALYGSFRFYGAVFCTLLTEQNRLNVEDYMAAKCGITL